MNRRGFALAGVLWLVATLAVLSAGSLALVRLRLTASRNRIILLRAEWAREACLDVMLGRGLDLGTPDAPRVKGTNFPLDLGRDTWCSIELEDPAARINLNTASEAAIASILGSDTLAQALFDWKDPNNLPRERGAEAEWYARNRLQAPRNGELAAVEELSLVRGFTPLVIARIRPWITVRGSGVINLNAASAGVLIALDLGPTLVQSILSRRSAGQTINGLDQLIGLAAPRERQKLMTRYQELSASLTFASREIIAHVTGGVRGYPPLAHGTATVVSLPERVAVLRREME